MSLEHRLHARCACASSHAEFGASARPFVLAGTRRVYERSRPFAIKHIGLDLTLDVKTKSIAGSAEIDFARVDPSASDLALDAVGFDVARVEIRVRDTRARRRKTNGASWSNARFVYDGEVLRVAVPADAIAATVRVAYKATPRRGLYFLEPDEHVRDRPRQVWSQCQDEDARHIFPCHDKPHIKQTTELRVRVPAGWIALSNGERVSNEREQKTGVFHFRMPQPHPSYLFTLVAGEFARIEDDADGVPVAYLVPKGREHDGKRTFARTPDMIRHFGELLGVPYPWNKYDQVVVSDFIFGGMENTTATTMYEHILLDRRAAVDITSDDLIAHELAHQWFGDLVTCRDWSHAWLNEGFATFMEHVDREHHLGADEYDYGLKKDLEAYIGEARGRYKRPVVCPDYESPIDIFDRHLYEKGALVLHMLRRELGDELFWKGIGTYLNRHRNGVVETRDLERALEDVSGRSLERFFEQWIFRPGHPELEVKVEYEHKTLTITVKQKQHTSATHAPSNAPDAHTPLFAFDLAFDLGEANGRVRREIRRVDQATQTFAFQLGDRPRFVVVDPAFGVVGELRIEAPGDMLRVQLETAPSARARWLAAEGLSRVPDPPTLAALGRSLADENEFWGVRAEAADALGVLRTEEAFELLSAHAKSKHPKVRRAVVHALGKFRTSKAADLLKTAALKDASYLVEAEAARALGATRQPLALDTLVEILDRASWADVIRSGAIEGLALLRDDRAIPHVIARTRYGVNTRGRRAAILALPKLSGDRKTREALEDLLDERDPYLRSDVVRAIVDLGDARSRAALQRRLDRELDGRVRRRIREALRDIGGLGKRETDRLRDELEALRAEHAELKGRLGKLESVMVAERDGVRPKPRGRNAHPER